MVWLLANWRIVLFASIVFALSVQTGRISLLKSEWAEEKAQIAAKEAQERARINANSTKALDDLQSRFAALSQSYDGLRKSANRVQPLSAGTKFIISCHGDAKESDTAARRLDEIERAVIEVLGGGDKELAKYVELWNLDQANSRAIPVQ